MRYELTWTWNSAGMNCHAALEEIGAPYSLRFIDFDEPWPEDDLARNPNHKVPTLIDNEAGDQGDSRAVIYQSAAILLYLADNHPEANLLPTVASPARGACYQWLFFMAEMLQPSFQMFYYPERHTMDESAEAQRAVGDKAIEWVDKLWSRIDEAIGEGPYFLGDQFSVCDLYMVPLARWNDSDEQFRKLTGYPNLSRVIANVRARPSVRTVLDTHCKD